MRLMHIAVHGDDAELHERALAAAVKAIEAVGASPVYRAWIAPVPEVARRGQAGHQPATTERRGRNA